MDFIGRKTWGAEHAAGFGSRPIPLDEAYLHHSVTTAPGPTLEEECRAMRVLERIGQQRFGGGVSYNLAVMPFSGRVFVGTGVRQIGAHTGGRNTPALGVVLVGNFQTTPVPEVALKALADLLRFGAENGWLRRPAFTGGHRDAPGASTSCPGRFAYDALGAINRAAARPPSTDTEPGGLLAPEPISDGGLDVGIMVQQVDGHAVWLCRPDGTRVHVRTPVLRDAHRQAGVPFLHGDTVHERARRAAMLETYREVPTW